MVKPGNEGLYIPEARANAAILGATQIGAADVPGARVFCADIPAGVIKWSWHIWVVDDKDVIELGAGTDNKWKGEQLCCF